MTAALRLRQKETSDRDLVGSIARGDLDALGSLFDRHSADIRRYLSRVVSSSADIDDLVQTTFLEVVRAAPSYDPQYPVRPWLFGIATMIGRRHRRSVARRVAQLAAWAGMPRGDGPNTPADQYENDEAARRLQRGFEQLSPKKREAFALVVIEGLSGEEAAAALGVPVNTIWTRLHHARRELREAVSGRGSR